MHLSKHQTQIFEVCIAHLKNELPECHVRIKIALKTLTNANRNTWLNVLIESLTHKIAKAQTIRKIA